MVLCCFLHLAPQTYKEFRRHELVGFSLCITKFYPVQISRFLSSTGEEERCLCGALQIYGVLKLTLRGQQKSDFSQFSFPRTLLDVPTGSIYSTFLFLTCNVGIVSVVFNLSFKVPSLRVAIQNSTNLVYTCTLCVITQQCLHSSPWDLTNFEQPFLLSLQSSGLYAKAIFPVYAIAVAFILFQNGLTVDKCKTLRPPVSHHVLIFFETGSPSGSSYCSLQYSKLHSFFKGQQWFWSCFCSDVGQLLHLQEEGVRWLWSPERASSNPSRPAVLWYHGGWSPTVPFSLTHN